MDNLGSMGDVQQYLEGINFPAHKEEVASGAEGNGAPQDLVQRIRNASTERFDGSRRSCRSSAGTGRRRREARYGRAQQEERAGASAAAPALWS